MTIFHIFWIHLISKNTVVLKSWSESYRVIKTDNIWYPGYGFLLASYGDFVSNMRRFWDIRLWKVQWPWNTGQQ